METFCILWGIFTVLINKWDMTYSLVKEKLHNYIESADQKKIKAIYALLEEDINHDRFVYDDELLNELEKRSEAAFSGKTKTYTLEESFEKIKKHRKKDGI